MQLFHSWLSSASRRVRLCLAEKGIDYESVPIDLSRQAQHEPAFLALNPNGVVPALRLGPGRSLHESSTICEYLDDAYPTPPLRPVDPWRRATMRNFIRWTDDQALPNLLILNWSLSLQPVASRWSDAELAERLARIPSPERREAWSRIARRPYTAAEKAAALAKLVTLLDRIEHALDGQDWIADADYTLADTAATPFVARLEELAADELDPQRRPRLARWWQATKARPSFAAARLERFDTTLKARASEGVAL